jgi:5-methylcytosine-specific restriction enzyme subunit McrC
MLSYSYDLNLRMRDVADIRGDRSDWFEILTRFFASELHTLFRRGVERQYVNFQETLPVVRGRWMIQEQIIRKPGVKHRFEISYDELSPDTPLNRIFKFVVDRLLRLSADPVNIRLLHELRDWLSDVVLPPEIRPEQLHQINFTRLNERFRPAFNMARLFLEQSAPILLAGGLPTFAFVFDMDKLFQEFVARFVRQHWRFIVPTLWDQVDITRQAKGNAVYLLEKTLPTQQHVLRLIPDLLFGANPTRLIADTKYKRLNPTDTRLGVAGSDMYQMLAYAVRFKCPNVLLIYPSLDGYTGLQARFEVPEQGIQFSVATVDLHHPLQDYQFLLNQLKLILNPLLQEAYGSQ